MMEEEWNKLLSIKHHSLRCGDRRRRRTVWFISINLKSGSGYEVWSLTESLTSSSNLDTCFFFEVAAGHFQGKASSLKVHQISTPVNVTQRLTGCHGGEAQCGANRGCVYRVITRKGCGQADTWASSQGAMFESVLKASCEIIDYRWTKDRAPVDTFIMGLATSIRERSDYEEEQFLLYIRLLAELNVQVKKSEVVDTILPLFIESFEEGEASTPGLLRLRLLDAVSRIASLGFEKSYREAVV
ncbi:hypothetical protein L2E82_11851 [Cichorium intybus]|uniref:Uncharacterized protein n=1 Tax=Cichorium intybus TaxID=13427 RepID=A0ACB9GFH0_CICIN|nr:hypothetical protein L2E82_11851 [Cichorium intybus]